MEQNKNKKGKETIFCFPVDVAGESDFWRVFGGQPLHHLSIFCHCVSYFPGPFLLQWFRCVCCLFCVMSIVFALSSSLSIPVSLGIPCTRFLFRVPSYFYLLWMWPCYFSFICSGILSSYSLLVLTWRRTSHANSATRRDHAGFFYIWAWWDDALSS